MATPILPRQQSPFLDQRTSFTAGEWYDFFRELLAFVGDNSDSAALIQEILVRLSALEDGSADAVIQGLASIHVNGTLAGGVVQVTLQGDTEAPGNTYYYGTSDDGTKGWHLVADTMGVTADLTKSVDGTTNVVTFGMADLANSGVGAALVKITRDAKGRVEGTQAATTDDLAEGATNLYHTAARVLATVLTGLSTASSAVITAADSVLSALGKLQAQITAYAADIAGLVIDSIADGDTTHAPSRNAVFDALALKLDKAGGVMTGSIEMRGALYRLLSADATLDFGGFGNSGSNLAVFFGSSTAVLRLRPAGRTTATGVGVTTAEFFPEVNNAIDLGLSSLQWKNVRIAGSYFVGTNQVVGARDTGWAAMTGTAVKTSIAAAAAGTASVGYVQAELQTALNRIAALEARMKAYDAALIAHGLIGT